MRFASILFPVIVALVAGCASVERQYRNVVESRDEERIRKFIRSHPESPLIMDAVVVLDTVRLENAIADSGTASLKHLLQAYPTSPLAPEASRILATRIRDEEMVMLRTELIEEERPDLLVELADRHRNKGEFDTADSLYNRALVLDPNVPAAHTGLAQIYLSQGKHQQADEEIDTARMLAPTNPAVLLAAGEYYRIIGRPDLAINSFQSLLNQEPDNIQAHLNLGLLYLDVGKNMLAIWSFMKVTELDRDNVAVLYHLGVAYADQGDGTTAVRYLDQYIRSPHTEEDSANLAKAQDLVERLRGDVKYGEGGAGSVVADPDNRKTPPPSAAPKPRNPGRQPGVVGGVNPYGRGAWGGGKRNR